MSAPTLAELKAYAGGERSLGSEHDIVLEEALAAAIATASREGEILVTRGEHVVYRSGGAQGTAALWFTAQPVTVTKVELRDVSPIQTEWSELDAAEWEQVGGRLQRRSGGSFLAGFSGTSYAFPPGASNIRVTLTAGFDEDNPMPADLRLAILKLAAAEFRQRRTATPTTERSAGTGAERVAIRSDALSVIRSYRQVPGF